MEVILLTNVPHVGRLGEFKRVSPGFARNYLFPRRLATLSTPSARRQMERQLEKKRVLLESQRQQALSFAEQLKGLEIQIPCVSGDGGHLFGSVTARQIAEHLKTRGFLLDKKCVILEKPIRTLGVHRVILKLPPDAQAEISVVVVSKSASSV